MKAAIIVFPGSNCDRDVALALESAMGRPPVMHWHGDAALPPVDLIVLPGGFSYGDYLRAGAMAAHSPVMREVVARARQGVAVLGICNGFQMLTETGLLPGALMCNAGLRFVSRPVALRVETTASPLLAGCAAGQVVRYPVAHMDGNYFADPETLARLEAEGRVAFRYVANGRAGEPETGPANPNGSVNDIAGLIDDKGTVLGLMPHPERAADPAHGLTDGRAFFSGLVAALAG
ncbi:MAG: phosphoribosylformylglycinamidine synthase subunit PurQ [Alphaproteobacteria bacterium]|jgi:phosphoribosylformylglycinamidine synthase|nr:phosphoribosylformylglycinamidine synthase subunit PurQ [Alphaproteobacteria bacterium]